MLDDAYDLLVVGEGPGGCAAAIWAARHDLSAAIVAAPPGRTERRGLELELGVEPLLWHLGLLEEALARGLLSAPSARGGWSEGRRFRLSQLEGERPWAPLRDFMLERAAELGVNVLRPARAKRAMRRRSGRVVGVDTELGPVIAELTLDAAGGRRWLAAQLGVAAPAGPGFFLVGDAAGEGGDPPAGVMRAMISGIKAAELSDKLLHDETSEPQATAEHRSLLERLRGRGVAPRLQPSPV